MKRYIWMVAAVAALLFTGCGGSPSESGAPASVSVEVQRLDALEASLRHLVSANDNFVEAWRLTNGVVQDQQRLVKQAWWLSAAACVGVLVMLVITAWKYIGVWWSGLLRASLTRMASAVQKAAPAQPVSASAPPPPPPIPPAPPQAP
jgi:hypothetical protein